MIITLAFGLVTSILYYSHLKKILMAEAFNKSEMVLREVEAIRGYVKSVLRPRMYEITSKDTFIIEAMSTTYISLNIMKSFEERMPGYLYRRVSLNPHNPKNSADAFEEEMFEWFETDRDRSFWQGMVKKGAESFFVSMIPDYLEEGCLRCHGKVEDAPRSLIEKYGPVGGFRFSNGDLAGLNSISIPVSKPLSHIARISVAIFIGTVFMMALLLFLLNLVFGKLVISRLTRLMGSLSNGENDKEDAAHIAHLTGTRDELDHLRESFRYLNRYVSLARKGAGLEPNFVGSYAVEAPLASGTLSWLYQARHTTTDKPVALKVPFDDILLNPLYTACLRTEMNILDLAGSHENLVVTIGGEGDALVLEALEGWDLASFIKNRQAPFGVKEGCLLFSQLCDLMAHLHNAGIVHHDLRPHNMMIDPKGALKLFDFGYASARDIPDAIFESGITPQGDFRYMAPEQMAGKRGDPRSDIYTLGVLLYQMSTTRLPFEKNRSTLKNRLHIKEAFKPPRVYAKDMSEALEQVILTAMAWDVEKRYQWVEDFWEDLNRCDG